MTFSYNYGIPDAPNDPADDQPKMKTNFQSIGDLLAVDHVSFNESNGGIHEQVTFVQNNIPVGFPNTLGKLFTNVGVGGVQGLIYYSGTQAQSADQYVAGSSGGTFVFAGFIIKWFQVNVSGSGGSTTYASKGLANFPNNAYNAQLTPGALGFDICVSSLSVSAINIGKSPSAGSVTVNVFIIGN